MNKNAIKKFATEARRELISRVSQRALKYGISDQEVGNPNDDSVNGHLLSSTEKKQRAALIAQIKEKGYEQVMEEVAYTWFNRFSALRFMEVNGYLPTRVRVFTDENNAFKPQILTEAIHMELDGLDMEKVYDYKEANDNDELYKYLLITQCNALNSVLPGMFQKIADYTELLFPDNLLREGSVVQQMIELIDEDDWKDAVQIIGWLYQYYIAEPKDERINARKKYVRSDIPFVTQLFTPDWIVRYMVENSLGRLWVEGHPSDDLKAQWKYYLEEVEPEPDVQDKLTSIREEYKALKPEDILCIDPCSGSGHILAYLFDVLVQIYEAYGVDTRTAVASIVENNIYGLDIDDRAAQLAYFSVMMKACQYDKRFLRRRIQPHVHAIVESNNIDKYAVEYFCGGNSRLQKAIDEIIEDLHNAKELGSVLNVRKQDWEALFSRFDEIQEESILTIYTEASLQIRTMVECAQILSDKYQVIVTNPPYMNASYMPETLKKYVQKNYADFKSDLFAVFTQKTINMAKKNGQIGLLMPYVWMFIASYEDMRKYINCNVNISSLVQLEYNAFEAACVPVASLTMIKTDVRTTGEYIKLSEFRGAENQGPRTLAAVEDRNCPYRYTATQEDFERLPGQIIAFWASKRVVGTFGKAVLGDILTTREGMATADNDSFLRLWPEVSIDNIGFGCADALDAQDTGRTWFPYNKGGDYRKWYGNNDYVVNWKNDGQLIRNNKDVKTGRIRSHNYNGEFAFRKGVTWSALSSSNISVRYTDSGFLFDSKGAKGFATSEDELYYAMALINSKVGLNYLSFISPTIDFKVGDIIQIPLIRERIEDVIERSKKCVQISKMDWDSFETSWDFKRHPLVRGDLISETYAQWENECNTRFSDIVKLEEEINSLFIDIYGLSGEITPSVMPEEVVIRKADLGRDVKSLISYAVGCMFGRYSLEKEGLQFAGGTTKLPENENFKVDADGIIPICNDDYFSDDITGRFIEFVKAAYGENNLEANLNFIADALGGKGTSRDVIRNYFSTGFYADHCNTYAVTGSGKRPIYWLFDSGKKNGFKCLVYVHRYEADTIARIRTDYVHEQQSRYRTAIEDLENRIGSSGTGEKVKLSKRLKTLQDQAAEIHAYEEKIHHLADQMIAIDINDGVKKNYAKFSDVLAKIK